MFLEIGVLKKFEKFILKHLLRSLFLIKFQIWPATLLKMDFGAGAFL